MNNKALTCGLAAALLVTGACSTASNTSNTKPAAAAATPVTAPTAPTAPASTAAAQDFSLVNSTGVDIDKVFISPHNVDDWEEDILGQDTLPDGEKVDIKFNRTETAPLWDLRVEDDKGNSIEWENLDLLKIAKLTLTYKDGKATAHAE